MKRNPPLSMSAFLAVLLIIEVPVMIAAPSESSKNVTVSLVTRSKGGPAERHGIRKLLAALRAKGVAFEEAASLERARGRFLIVPGVASGGGAAAKLHKALKVPAPKAAEALVIRRGSWEGRQVLLVSGADDRGLMYALLDVADRVGWAKDPKDPLSEVKDAAEKPYCPERSLSKYTMNRAHFESYFHDEKYWARFLDMLARNRYNTFALLFAYESSGYFAPPYPHFFDVKGFDDVRVGGLTKAQQRRNLESLNRLIRMTHERGLNFTLGIWDHIYRGGVQGGRPDRTRPRPGLVWGVTRENLIPYTTAALAKLVKVVPDIDAIQFRMHGESGLKRDEMHKFWPEIYKIMKETGDGIRFDARAKNFPDSLIDKAVEMDLDIRMCTKYWAEQMGMPFHPTHINRQNQRDRRHGYADMLRYPRKYKMHWRLWNGGTTRILLWGDPEFVRRFAASTQVYDGDGFEVNEPLATKMQDHPHDMKPFDLLAPKYQYYDWEFERYWHFFQVFGRVGYNPDTPAEIWQMEFQKRFGKDAAPYVERALHRASWILPRIVACIFPYGTFPTTRGWVEKQRRGDLPRYAKAETGDTQQFMNMDEAARILIEGKDSPKTHPLATSEWFAKTAADVLKLAGEAEKRIGKNRNKEFDSTIVDLKILAGLAMFHSRRIHAGLAYALFDRTKDVNALDDAIAHEARAIEAWEGIVAAAGDVYHKDLRMGRRGSGLAGHWKDELDALNKGMEKLRRQRKAFKPSAVGDGPWIEHVPIRKSAPGKDLVIRATVSGKGKMAAVRLEYGVGPSTREVEMKQTGPFVYRGTIPGAKVTGDISYFIITAADTSRRKSTMIMPISVTVTDDNEPPTLTHERIATAPAGKPLTVTADVRDPSGVKWVRLRYRSVTQFDDYRTLEMKPTRKKGQYQVVVPGEHLPAVRDFMYFIEVMDTKGNGKMYPDFNTEMPYVIVRLKRGGS